MPKAKAEEPANIYQEYFDRFGLPPPIVAFCLTSDKYQAVCDKALRRALKRGKPLTAREAQKLHDGLKLRSGAAT
jgi:hypothetical protein